LVSGLIGQILRDHVRKPTIGSSSEQLDFSATKKTKKMYALSHEKWHLATKISPEKYRQSEQNYFKMEDEEDLDKKLELLDLSREFLQVQFRTLDPTNHIQGLKNFWEQPFGLHILSAWFEWVTNGSRDGCLKQTVAGNSEMVFSMIKRFLSDMKGESWNHKFEEVHKNSIAKFGNDTESRIFLIRDLARTWKNQPEKILFCEDEDDLSKMSKQPFIHILSISQLGVGDSDYDFKLKISLRVGTTVIFDDISLVEAFAGLIQVIFSFNLMYPVESDDMFQFIQRIMASFGPTDGARNKSGKVRKPFLDFQCAVGKIMLETQNADLVKKLI